MDYKKIVKKYEKEVISNLKKWISIPSVYDEKTISKDKPFGKDVADALEFIAQLGEQYGFKVDRCDGYCTELSYGKGPLISVFSHCDVVPVSGDWKHDPFSGEIEDGKMYGRGTSDDKGPGLAAFFAAVALKENNLIDGYKLRLVYGGNEESGSECLEYYFKKLHKPYPKYGFTPDGEFPLIYGEKGIANYKVEMELKHDYVKEIHGGVAANSVIDEAYAIIETTRKINELANKYFSATDCKYELIQLNESHYKLIVHGIAAHGSLPNLGVNAGLALLRFLSVYYSNPEFDIPAKYYFDGKGIALNQYYESELLHETTYNVGIIDYKDNQLTYIVNFRYPENVSPRDVIKELNKLGIGNHTLLSLSKPLLIDPKSKMVQTLLDVYQSETNDKETKIMAIGGGTYAKESKNTLAFGSHFPHSDDRIHNSNETIMLKDLLTSMYIYAHAIDALGKLCD